MQTLSQLIQLFEDKKANHAILKNGTFEFKYPSEVGQDSEIVYPLWVVWLENSVISGNDFSTTFRMFFCDLTHKDDSNETDVLSEQQIIATDIYSQIKWDLENYFDATVNVSATLEDRRHSFNDDVTGWELALEVKQFYDHSVCSTISVGNAGKVILYNAYGSINQILNPNSFYFLEENMTETAETYTVTGTTQIILHTPNFIFGVFLNGQKLTLTTDFTISGTTITFINALASDIVTIVYNY